MKKYLLFLLVPLVLGSCTKIVIENENTLSGRWVLAYAQKQNNFETKTIFTGLEGGYFYFYNNGRAEFDNGYDLMEGSWQVNTVYEGYYDYNGNYHGGRHQVFTLNLYDSYTGKEIYLDFDDSWFSGHNRFTGQYDSYTHSYRYVFERQ